MSDSIPAPREGETLTCQFCSTEPNASSPTVCQNREEAEQCSWRTKATAVPFATPATDGARAGVPDDLRALFALAEDAPLYVHDFADPTVSLAPGPCNIHLSFVTPDHITAASMGYGIAGTINAARHTANAMAGAWNYVRDLIADPRPQAGGAPGGTDLVAYLHRQWAWSKETFGPALRTKGIVQHITKELREIEADPHDLSEWVDVIILAMDGFWRHGGAPEDLLPRMQAKQDKNFARTWPDWRTIGEDQAIEHDRSRETAITRPAADPGGQADDDTTLLRSLENELGVKGTTAVFRRALALAKEAVEDARAGDPGAQAGAVELRKLRGDTQGYIESCEDGLVQVTRGYLWSVKEALATPTPAATGAGADRVEWREAMLMARQAVSGHVEAFRPWTEKIAGRVNPWQATLDAVDAALSHPTPPAPSADPVSGPSSGYWVQKQAEWLIRRDGENDRDWIARLRKHFTARFTSRPEAPSADPVPAGQGDGASALERVRHVRTGGEYEVIGEAEAQVAVNTVWRHFPPGVDLSDVMPAALLRDGLNLTVYRSRCDGKIWCRPTTEFRDGRFETIAPPAPSNAGGAV